MKLSELLPVGKITPQISVVEASKEARQAQQFIGRKLVKFAGDGRFDEEITLVFDNGKKLTISGNYGEGITLTIQ
jgi:hypothetical protein